MTSDITALKQTHAPEQMPSPPTPALEIAYHEDLGYLDAFTGMPLTNEQMRFLADSGISIRAQISHPYSGTTALTPHRAKKLYGKIKNDPQIPLDTARLTAKIVAQNVPEVSEDADFKTRADKELATGRQKNAEEFLALRDDFTFLLGLFLPPPLKNNKGELNLALFKNLSRDQMMDVILAQASLYDAHAMTDPYKKLLGKKMYIPLFDLIDPNTDVNSLAGGLATEKLKQLFHQLLLNFISQDELFFVKNALPSERGRGLIRQCLQSRIPAGLANTKPNLIKALATAAKDYEAQHDGNGIGKLLPSLDYFNWSVTATDLAAAGTHALSLLNIIDETEAALQARDQLLDLADPKSADLIRQASQQSNPVAELQASLASLYLITFDNERWTDADPDGALQNHLHSKLPTLIARLDAIEFFVKGGAKLRAEQELKGILDDLDDMLEESVEKSASSDMGDPLEWPEADLDVGERAEAIANHLKRPLMQLIQLVDELKAAKNMGMNLLPEKILPSPTPKTLEDTKTFFVGGLQKVQRQLWHGYKQHCALSRGISWTADLVDHGDQNTIRTAINYLDGKIKLIQNATTWEQMDSYHKQVVLALSSQGVLTMAEVAAEMEGIEGTLHLMQTTLEIVALALVTSGVGSALRSAKGVRDVAAITRGPKSAPWRVVDGFGRGIGISVMENGVHGASGQAGESGDINDAIATALSMCLTGLLPVSGAKPVKLGRTEVPNVIGRYLDQGYGSGIIKLGADTGTETIEEWLDAFLQNFEVPDVNEAREIFMQVLAGGGFKLGALAESIKGNQSLPAPDDSLPRNDPRAQNLPKDAALPVYRSEGEAPHRPAAEDQSLAGSRGAMGEEIGDGRSMAAQNGGSIGNESSIEKFVLSTVKPTTIGRGQGLEGRHFSRNELTFTPTADGIVVEHGNRYTEVVIENLETGKFYFMTGKRTAKDDPILPPKAAPIILPPGKYRVTIKGRALVTEKNPPTIYANGGVHHRANGTTASDVKADFASFEVSFDSSPLVIDGNPQIMPAINNVIALGSESFVFLRRTNDGWKIANHNPNKMLVVKRGDGPVISVGQANMLGGETDGEAFILTPAVKSIPPGEYKCVIDGKLVTMTIPALPDAAPTEYDMVALSRPQPTIHAPAIPKPAPKASPAKPAVKAGRGDLAAPAGPRTLVPDADDFVHMMVAPDEPAKPWQSPPWFPALGSALHPNFGYATEIGWQFFVFENQAELTMGRNPGSDTHVEISPESRKDKTQIAKVSRLHCKIVHVGDDLVTIINLSDDDNLSINGTFMKKNEEHFLEENDIIKLPGDVEFIYRGVKPRPEPRPVEEPRRNEAPRQVVPPRVVDAPMTIIQPAIPGLRVPDIDIDGLTLRFFDSLERNDLYEAGEIIVKIERAEAQAKAAHYAEGGPRSPSVFHIRAEFMRGDLAKERGNNDEALSHYKNVFDTHNRSQLLLTDRKRNSILRHCYRQMARIYMKQEMYAMALVSINEALKLKPNSEASKILRHEILKKLNRPK